MRGGIYGGFIGTKEEGNLSLAKERGKAWMAINLRFLHPTNKQPSNLIINLVGGGRRNTGCATLDLMPFAPFIRPDK